MRSLKDFDGILEENAPLAALTSFRVGGPARWLFSPGSADSLGEVIAFLEGDRIEHRMLGGGTNILASDGAHPLAVVHPSGALRSIRFDSACATAGAGAPLAALVRECARRGLSGAEALGGIPGSVGGALVMNAGGRHGTVSSIIESVTVLDDGRLREIAAADIEFEYRSSSLSGRVVVSARLCLSQDSPDAVTARTGRIIAEKRASQPLSARSAGCVFKNPPDGEAAGALIDRAGLKGFRIGGAEVSQRHANFIINTGLARAGEILELIEVVRSTVFERFGVKLEREIELW